MDVWAILQLYIVIALAISSTSYITLYRPGIALLEEILEQKTIYSSIVGAIMWLTLSTIFAPLVALVLLMNDNIGFSQTLAVNLANKYLEEEE